MTSGECAAEAAEFDADSHAKRGVAITSGAADGAAAGA